MTERGPKTRLANLRHDLRTPLNAVIGYCEMLLEDAEELGPASYEPRLNQMLEAGKVLLNEVNDVLDPVRVESGRIGTDLGAFAEWLQERLAERLRVVRDLSESLVTDAEADGNDEALPDLVKIRAAAKRFSEILQEFTAFSELSAAVKDTQPAPTRPQPAPAPEPPVPTALDAEEGPQHATILVTDDNEDNRELLRRHLERQGHTVLQAEDGHRALELITNKTVDLVLMDVMMPGIDGFETTRQIRAMPEHSDLPVIMVTALGSKEHRLKAVEAGASDFVSKPVDKVELQVRMASLLKMKEAQDAVKRHRAELEETVERRTEALRHQTELYRSVLTSSADAIVLQDLKGNVQYVSPSFTQIFGWDIDELAGSPIPFVPETERLPTSTLFETVITENRSISAVETKRLTKDGRLLDVLLSASCFHDRHGNAAGLLITMSDITERKRARERLAAEQAARNHIREIFGKYLSEDVVTEILEAPGGVNLGGEFRKITILVSDLRGFTPLTESLEPKRLVELLNRYLEQMTEIILGHGGVIDKFMGDGILVYFGAPKQVPDHPRRAVSCALSMQESMVDLNREFGASGLPPLNMGIGINTGTLVVGNIGSERRKEYGAVGSAINVAFRVESQTSAGEILVTPAVYQAVGQELRVRSTREALLKGIENPVLLYDVTGLAGREITSTRT